MMNKGTGLGPELALTGMKRCEITQIGDIDSDNPIVHSSQGNIHTLPGYLKDELLVFRDQDPVLREFEIKIFHQKKPHCG